MEEVVGFLRAMVSFSGILIGIGLIYYGYRMMDIYENGLLARAAKIMVISQGFYVSGFILVEMHYGLGYLVYPPIPGIRRWALVAPFLTGAIGFLYIHYKFGTYFGVIDMEEGEGSG